MTPSVPVTTVSGAPPAAAAPVSPAGAAPAAPAAPAVDAVALQRQIDELKEQVAEGQRTAQYWADKARGGTPAKVVEPEDDTDVLETITTKGAKGFDELASKRGFIRKAEVEELINTRAQSLTKEQELITEYPDLKKKDSEFFKATASNYGALVKGGTPQAVAMELAAKQTELEFIRSGKIKLPGAEKTKEEKEEERLARVKAQSGEGGGRRAAASTDEGDDELSDVQKRIADSMGVTHEAYLKRAKAGVKMGGLR